MRSGLGPGGLVAVAVVVIASWLTTLTASAPVDFADAGREPAPTMSERASEAEDTSHEDNVLLVWGHGGTDSDFSDLVAGLPDVVAVSAVHLDRRDLAAATAAEGTPTTDLPVDWVYPLDTAAIDAADHVAVLGTAADDLLSLTPGEALLSESSAALRGLGPGATLTMSDGSTRHVVGVVDDRVVGFAELIVHPNDPLGVDIERYLLVRHEGSAERVAEAIRGAADEELRITPMSDVVYPRHGDGVLPQVVIKTHFGEFAMLDLEGRRVQVGQTWKDEHLVARTLPHVGFTLCHRIVTEAFEDVLADLEGQGLLDAINPSQYQGCWLGRVIGASRTLSHHSWGLAVDVNVNPADVFTAHLPRAVIDTFERHGFVWGGEFLRPDEPHFEYVGALLGPR